MKPMLHINVLVGALGLALGMPGMRDAVASRHAVGDGSESSSGPVAGRAFDDVAYAPVAAAGMSIPAHPDSLLVTNCNDTGPGSLRDIVAGAVGGDTIDLRQLPCSTITLQTGSIVTSADDLAFIGPGTSTLTIDGANQDRIFKHTGNGLLRLTGLAIAHGRVHHAGGSSTQVFGGCVYGHGNIVLDHVRVDTCTIDGSAEAQLVGGGAVAAVNGNATLIASTLQSISAANAQTIKGAGVYAKGVAKLSGSTILRAVGYANGRGLGGCLYTGADTGSTIENSMLSACHIAGGAGAAHVAKGGGVYALHDLAVVSSTISSNTSAAETGDGGGLHIGGNARVDRATIDANWAFATAGNLSYGGGIEVVGQGSITASTINANKADVGAGIATLAAHIGVVDSTISGNIATQFCGGIYTKAQMGLKNSTVSLNTSAVAGAGGISSSGGYLSMQSSIVFGNLTAGSAFDIGASGFPVSVPLTLSGANNVVGFAYATALPSDTLHTDPLLAPLADNGGPTRTHALDPASPAIDAGNNVANLGSDQRGERFSRAFGGGADIGAFELQPLDQSIFSNGFEQTVTCSAPINHAIAQTFDGTWLNWFTGDVFDGNFVPSNFNAYATGTDLSFFWSSTSDDAGVSSTTGGPILVLHAGDMIGPASLFSHGSASTAAPAANWRQANGVDGYLGFKFDCMPGGPPVCYGYAHMTTTGTTGFPATLVDYCYDTRGAAITIPGG